MAERMIQQILLIGVCSFVLAQAALAANAGQSVALPELPEAQISEAYRQAAEENVLAAVNPQVFPGYWSVCGDGQGFGFGNTYPSLDGHQMTDALLWLGQIDVVKANWDYVRSFQRPDGQLPLAILPGSAGKEIGQEGAKSKVDANGGLYRHWVPGDPLRALAGPTFIQNADVIFRCTQNRTWLAAQRDAIHRAADHLALLISQDGAVGGAGYYVERPTRIAFDGVAQCYAIDAFRRVAALDDVLGDKASAQRYRALADRVAACFATRFWVGRQFAEYIHPERGVIARHGLTDVDWAAIATGAATAQQRDILWPQLKDEQAFHYGGVPAGITTRPDTYETWEFTTPDRHDLAAMGRVWYLESWARRNQGDAEGLLAGLQAVAKIGRENNYSWRERYQPDGRGGYTPAGPEWYCEYPANLIRIVQRFLLGVEFGLDGSVVLAPVAPEEFWQKGFGQTLRWRGQTLAYRMQTGQIRGRFSGLAAQRLLVRLGPNPREKEVQATIGSHPAVCHIEDDLIALDLPPAPAEQPFDFTVSLSTTSK